MKSFWPFSKTDKLFGQGLGWIDVHLLASAEVETGDTLDFSISLQNAALKLRCDFEQPTIIVPSQLFAIAIIYTKYRFPIPSYHFLR